MTHTQVRNAALYADRTVQDWHRDAMPGNADALDIDLLGVCADRVCRRPLYVIESTTNPDKNTGMVRALARHAGAVAVLVVHNTDQIVEWRRESPRGLDAPRGTTGEELRHYLLDLRADHDQTAHLVTGRYA